MSYLKNGNLLLPFFGDLLLRKFDDCKVLLTPPPTQGEGVWGWGNNRAREERLTPSGDQSLLRCVRLSPNVKLYLTTKCSEDAQSTQGTNYL